MVCKYLHNYMKMCATFCFARTLRHVFLSAISRMHNMHMLHFVEKQCCIYACVPWVQRHTQGAEIHAGCICYPPSLIQSVRRSKLNGDLVPPSSKRLGPDRTILSVP